jgi:hypothetical protein
LSEFEPNYGRGIAADGEYPIVIWHDGQPTESGTAVTAATVTVTADTSITLGINGAADARLGATGVIAHATWGTWGLIMQEINSAQGWHCRLLDAHFDGLPDHMSTLSETSCFQTEVGIPQDTSDDKHLGVGIANYKAGTTMQGTQACIYYLTGQCTDSGSPILRIYDCDDAAGTEKEVHYYALTTATEYSFPTYGPTSAPIYVAKPGHRILVLISEGASMTAGRLNVIGGLKQIA